jgi:hypothetical protein
MTYIRSANVSKFEPLEKPGNAIYHHGAEKREGYIPLAFQVTSPYDKLRALLPHALISHVNPTGFSETFNKKIERIQTRGGFVEQHWGDDLGEISVDSSTGAFVNLYTGLSSILRQRTIAWDRYRDLYDLYRHNGSVYDPFGAIVLQGHVMVMYDRGTYLGHFKSFSVEETDESPFAFKVSWSFKVVETIYQIPINAFGVPLRSPTFQSQNQSIGDLGSLPPGQTAAGSKEAAKQAQDAAKADAASQVLRAEAESHTVKGAVTGAVAAVGGIFGSGLPGQVPTPTGTSVKVPR